MYCEKYKCTISVEGCLARRRIQPWKHGQPKLVNEFCTSGKCVQGERNERMAKKVESAKEEPVKAGRMVTIDFTAHGILYDAITAVADKQFRTVENQIMYLLSSWIEERG
jgi:hypothetical protein